MPRKIADEDTIVVKGDESSSVPSSPASTGSDFEDEDRDAMESPKDLESPEPEELEGINNTHTRAGSSTGQSNRTFTHPAYLDQIPHKDHSNSTMEERLQMMPEKRILPFRDTVEPGAEVETGGDSRRKQIRFGCLLATRGNVVPFPCNSCANGRGKFTDCIALDGFFKGACASCQLSGRPNRCSIKTNEDEVEALSPYSRTPVAHSQTRQASQQTSAQQTPNTKPTPEKRTQEVNSTGPPTKRQRVEDKVAERPRWTEPPVVDQGLGSARSRGRPRGSLMTQYTSPWASVNTPVSSSSNTPTTRNNSTPVNNTRGVSTRNALNRHAEASNEATSQKNAPSNTNTPQSATSRQTSTSWAAAYASQSQTKPQPQTKPQAQTKPQPETKPQAQNGPQPQTQVQFKTRVPAQSQPATQPQIPSQPQQPSSRQSQARFESRPQSQVPTTSLKEFVDQQMLENHQNGTRSSHHSTTETEKQERKESSAATSGKATTPSTSLMDSLPKSKQRQIYGIISGIQGGIDHLNSQLESLKKALGIDDEN